METVQNNNVETVHAPSLQDEKYENSEYNSENYNKIRNSIPKNCVFRRIIVADYVRNNAKNYIFLHEIMQLCHSLA